MEYFSKIINESGSYAVDETILLKGVETPAGSRILGGFKSLFSAEAVDRLTQAGYSVKGTTPVGEFGLDLTGEFSYGHEQQGKLFGAAAQAVKSGEAEFALGVDMNGAARRAAALSGADFLKPTYGTVSRYGIISCAASGEQVGVYAADAETIAKTMKIIAGHDDKDGTSLPDETYDYVCAPVAGKKLALFGNLLDKVNPDVKDSILGTVDVLRKQGVEIETVDFDFCELADVSWQILMCAETCNNVSRYDGVKFGFRAENYKDIDELYVNTRTEGLNFLTKAVILYGSDVLSKKRYEGCYEKSLRARRMISEKLNSLFETYDAVITPVCSASEYESYDISEAFTKVFEEMIYTSAANLTGIPALSCGKVQFLGKAFSENTLLGLASAVEQEVK